MLGKSDMSVDISTDFRKIFEIEKNMCSNMKHEPITARELCRMVLQKSNEPITASEVWEIAVKYGYDKRYISDAVDKSAAPKALLSTESQIHGEFKRDNNSSPYRYSLRYPPIIDYEKDDEDATKRAQEIIETANQKARKTKDIAERKAKQTIDDAEQTAQQTIENAKQQATEIIGNANDKIGTEEKSTIDTVETTLKVVVNKIDESFERVGLLIEQKLSEATKLRQLAEDDKITAEGLRKSAEDDKVKAEELTKLAEAYKIEAERLKKERQEFDDSIFIRNKEAKETEQRIKTETEQLEKAAEWANKLMNNIHKVVDTRPVLKGYRVEVALIGKKDTMESIQKKIHDIGISTEIREVDIKGEK